MSCGVMAMPNLTGATAHPKAQRFVSQKARDSARGEDCQLRLACCNCDPSTTVLAHIRKFGWAGAAQKPDDFLAVYACSACHDAFDRRARETEWTWEDITRAHGNTLRRMFEKGVLRFG